MESRSDIFISSSSKTVAVIFSVASVIILTPSYLGIISFERNRHHRTLVNQMMASIVWTAALWNWLVQPLAIYRAAVGPIQPEIICRVNSVLRNSLPLHALLLLDAMMLIKYVFLFHMKNPTAIQDDFWNRCLNVVFFGLANLAQIVHTVSPGPESENFLICVGKSTDSGNVQTASKRNYSVIFVLIVSAATYLIFGTKYFYWKLVLNNNDRRQQLRQLQQLQLQNDQIQSSSDVLVSTTTNGLIMILLFSGFIVIRNGLQSLQEQTTWFYALQLYLPSAIQLAAVLYFAKNKQLRNHLKVEFFDFMSKFYPKRKKSNQVYSVRI